jgi:hypothetical protein
MSRFSLYFGTGLLSVGFWQFLSLITRSVPNFTWLYWSGFFTLIIASIIGCTTVARQIYSGQFATSSPTWLTVIVIILISSFLGVIWGWGF